MPIDPRFLVAEGREVFTGNELLVKGALEAEGGVHLHTGYPGSPIAGFFDALADIKDLLKEHGVRAFQSNNEALGSAAVNGAQMVGARAICAMKNVGLHVAADALVVQRGREQELRRLLAQQKDVQQKIVEVYEALDDVQARLIDSIPVLGVISTAATLVVVRDVTRFKSAAALKAYLGIDPRRNQREHAKNRRTWPTTAVT